MAASRLLTALFIVSGLYGSCLGSKVGVRQGQPSFDAEMQSAQSTLDSIMGSADGLVSQPAAPVAARPRHASHKRKVQHRRHPHLVAAAVASTVASSEGFSSSSAASSAATAAGKEGIVATSATEDTSEASSSGSAEIEDAILHSENSGLTQNVKDLQAKLEAGRHFDSQLTQALRTHDSLLRKSEFLMKKHMLVLDRLDDEKKAAQKEEKQLQEENAKLKKKLASQAEETLLAKAQTTSSEVHLRASEADSAELKSELQAQQRSAAQARSSYEASEAQDRSDLAIKDARVAKLQKSLDEMQAQLAGTLQTNSHLQSESNNLASGLRSTQAQLGQVAQMKVAAEQKASTNWDSYKKSLLQLQAVQQEADTHKKNEQSELQEASSLAASLNQARSGLSERERQVQALQQEIADRALIQQQVNEQRSMNAPSSVGQDNMWGSMMQPPPQPNMELLQSPL